MVDNSRQALVGAIGGTYISLATIDIDELAIANFALLNSANFTSPMEAIERYLKSLPKPPAMVGLSIAGTVEGERAQMSHLPWSFDRDEIRAVSGARHVCFVNEFEALALALPHMTEYDRTDIGRGKARRYGTKAVVSAGTGLGTAALVRVGEHWHALSGQSRFAGLVTAREDGFDLHALVTHAGPVLAGEILTGSGMVKLYRTLAGRPDAALTPPQISKAGLSGEDAAARQTLELLAIWLGRFAGDIALHFGADGGLYLAGGLPSNVVPALQTGRFREAFEGDGERRAVLAELPVHVLKPGADPGLRGAAVALANSLPPPAVPARRRPA